MSGFGWIRHTWHRQIFWINVRTTVEGPSRGGGWSCRRKKASGPGGHKPNVAWLGCCGVPWKWWTRSSNVLLCLVLSSFLAFLFLRLHTSRFVKTNPSFLVIEMWGKCLVSRRLSDPGIFSNLLVYGSWFILFNWYLGNCSMWRVLYCVWDTVFTDTEQTWFLPWGLTG